MDLSLKSNIQNFDQARLMKYQKILSSELSLSCTKNRLIYRPPLSVQATTRTIPLAEITAAEEGYYEVEIDDPNDVKFRFMLTKNNKYCHVF